MRGRSAAALAFYAGSNGGGAGVWLLGPGLRLRSKVNLDMRRYHGAAPFDVLPTGADTAMLATSWGLARLTLPLPGQPGTAAVHCGRALGAARYGPCQNPARRGRAARCVRLAVRWAAMTGGG